MAEPFSTQPATEDVGQEERPALLAGPLLRDGVEAGQWGEKYPTIAASWRRAWEQVIPFFAYPTDVRRIIHTTNAIESLNMQLRKIIKTRGQLMSLPLHPAGSTACCLSRSARLPSDEAATKLLYLALRNIAAKWTSTPLSWKAAANQFAIQFGSRFLSSSTH